MSSNPFMRYDPHLGHEVGAVGVDDRLHAVRRFNEQQCREALALPGLQKVVYTAIRGRMRYLERTAAAAEGGNHE